MGRKAGVTADETRAELLAAAARVFARSGFDKASISEITNEANLSSGAVYSHFPSKAALFAAALRHYGDLELEHLLGSGDVTNVADLVTVLGSSIDRRSPSGASLIVEAIVASKRDPEIAEITQGFFAEREAMFAELLAVGQFSGEVSDSVSSAAMARLSTMVALGSLLVEVLQLPEVDHDDWALLVTLLVDSLRAAGER